MAPLIQLTVQVLSYLPSFRHQASPQTLVQSPQVHTLQAPTPSLSAISWAKGRQDVFLSDYKKSSLMHKYYDGSQWQPSGTSMEFLGDLVSSALTAASWGDGRMDVCAVTEDGGLLHKYYDTQGDNAWIPSQDSFELLSSSANISQDIAIAATSWGVGRLDIFTVSESGEFLLKYFDGSSWGPAEGELENLGGSCSSGPAAVAWGPNRNDVFCASNAGGQDAIFHTYWDGSNWSEFTLLYNENAGEIAPPVFGNMPTAISWGVNRLDVFAINLDGELWHKAWDGSQWLNWEILGTGLAQGTVAANSWSEGRIDIVALGTDGAYVSISFIPIYHILPINFLWREK